MPNNLSGSSSPLEHDRNSSEAERLTEFVELQRTLSSSASVKSAVAHFARSMSMGGHSSPLQQPANTLASKDALVDESERKMVLEMVAK